MIYNAAGRGRVIYAAAVAADEACWSGSQAVLLTGYTVRVDTLHIRVVDAVLPVARNIN